MTDADIAGVQAVANQVHPDLPEGEAMIANRINIYPQGCLVLASPEGTIFGYAISHPIVPFSPPALDSVLGSLSAEALQYYIHDIAINPDLRGGGYARPAIERLLMQASVFETTALISVYGTAPFWRRFGFETTTNGRTEKLLPYGEDAVLMVRLN